MENFLYATSSIVRLCSHCVFNSLTIGTITQRIRITRAWFILLIRIRRLSRTRVRFGWWSSNTLNCDINGKLKRLLSVDITEFNYPPVYPAMPRPNDSMYGIPMNNAISKTDTVGSPQIMHSQHAKRSIRYLQGIQMGSGIATITVVR